MPAVSGAGRRRDGQDCSGFGPRELRHASSQPCKTQSPETCWPVPESHWAAGERLSRSETDLAASCWPACHPLDHLTLSPAFTAAQHMAWLAVQPMRCPQVPTPPPAPCKAVLAQLGCARSPVPAWRDIRKVLAYLEKGAAGRTRDSRVWRMPPPPPHVQWGTRKGAWAAGARPSARSDRRAASQPVSKRTCLK